MGRREPGFTLIELLLIVVILGLLASIVVFSVVGLSDKGAASACKSEVSTIRTAANAYYAYNRTPVATLRDLMPGFLSQDPDISGNVKTRSGANGYKITFVPGSGTDVGTVSGDLNGGSVSTDCSS
jgi:general secretion pathway protein G